MQTKGVLVVVSGFSGAGKGTVMKALLNKYDNYALSVSATTRNPRPGEENGREYFFLTESQFEDMIKNDELIEHAIHVARYRELPGRIDFCTAGSDPADPRGAVHRCIHSVAHLIEDHAAAAGLPLRFAATKLVEGDTLIEKALQLNPNETDILGHAIAEMETVTGLDREAALADMRFTFIEKLCSATVVKPGESLEHKRSVAIDKILTGKYTALPCFAGIMALVFWLTFGVVGSTLSDWMTLGIDWFTGVVDCALTAYQINPVVHSLVIDGIFAGVGSVLSFLPTIVILFFFLSVRYNAHIP